MTTDRKALLDNLDKATAKRSEQLGYLCELSQYIKEIIYRLSVLRSRPFARQYDAEFGLGWEQMKDGKFNLYAYFNHPTNGPIRQVLLGTPIATKLQSEKYLTQFVNECIEDGR